MSANRVVTRVVDCDDVTANGNKVPASLLPTGSVVQAWSAKLDDLAAIAPAKGTLAAYNGTHWVGQAVGADGTVLTADAAQADGVKWSAVGGTGTVTSVALTVPAWLTVAGSPVTTAGTLAVTATGAQTANQFLATPNGGPGAVGLRAIVAADLPNIAESQVTNLVSDLAAKAPLASPALTGTPTAPTAAAATNTTQVATTAFVLANSLSPTGNGSGLTGITESQVTNLVSDLALKAPLASPALTGTPTAPTPTAGTNTTQVATTAYVLANSVASVGGAVLIHPDGTCAVYKPTANTDTARATAYSAAVSAAASGDKILLGPGTYDYGSSAVPPNVPAGVSVEGAGRLATTLKTSQLGNGGFALGTGSALRNLTTLSTTGDCLGDGSVVATGVVVENVDLSAGSTGIHVFLAAASAYTLFHCRFLDNATYFKSISVAVASALLRLFGCEWVSSTAPTLGEIVCSAGTVEVYGGAFRSAATVQVAQSSTGVVRLTGTDYSPSLCTGTVTLGSVAGAAFGASGTGHAPGQVPDPGGSAGTTHYLREDGTWAVPAGGGGSPGGSSGQVQYDNAGGFGGAANLNVTSGGNPQLAASAAPGSPTDGELWYDSTQKALTVRSAGMSVRPPGVFFTATTTAAVTNTTSETTLVGSGVGSTTLKANSLVAGRTINGQVRGYYGCTGSNPTLTIKVKIGAVVLTSSAQTLGGGATQTNASFVVDFSVTCYTTGATGTVWAQGVRLFSLGATGGWPTQGMPSTAAVTVDTTADAVLDVTATWGTASATNTVTATNVRFWEEN